MTVDFDNVLKTNNPATTRQMKALEKLGYVPARAISFEQATKVLDTLMDRVRAGLCTLKQGHVLKKAGYDPKNITFKQASVLIERMLEDQAGEQLVY